jgi:hypothetical protein
MTEETKIPLTTLKRLFQTAVFEHDDTRITEQALELSSEYLRMFIREAVLRANEARVGTSNDDDNGVVTEQLVSDVLDTQHLDEIAGLLLLDF